MKQKRYQREQRTYYFHNSIEVERVYRGKGGARGQERKKRKKASPEQIKLQNQYNREKNMRRIMAANFREDDLWILLTYKKATKISMKEAKKDFTKFIRILRREYKKRNQELKWVVRTEVGSRGAVHHHLLVNRIPDGELIVKKCWKNIEGSGFPSFKYTYEEGGFKKLAAYITKEPEKEGIERNYRRSRNMDVPEPEISRAKAKEMREYPVALPGYYIDPESVTMGINPYTGQEYQYFIMHRLKKKRKGEGG